MAAAPLPPHERPWRHPSELGPTAAAVEPSSVRSRLLALSSGAVAVVLVAAMVVAVTPRRSSAPSAVSATTIPVSVQARPQAAAIVEVDPGDRVLLGTRSLSNGGPSAALLGAPNAISTSPVAEPVGLRPAVDRPQGDDRVLVLTVDFTYDVPWSVVADLWAPPGSIVITRSGELLATFGDDGRALVPD